MVCCLLVVKAIFGSCFFVTIFSILSPSDFFVGDWMHADE
ncbi:putative membrane protein [Synechococcus sp. BIOS-E4-1]|nr:putative membrane protein [Synechococcus sp. BIOS-E4-1]